MADDERDLEQLAATPPAASPNDDSGDTHTTLEGSSGAAKGAGPTGMGELRPDPIERATQQQLEGESSGG